MRECTNRARLRSGKNSKESGIGDWNWVYLPNAPPAYVSMALPPEISPTVVEHQAGSTEASMVMLLLASLQASLTRSNGNGNSQTTKQP
jgi:hypothetical protein